MNSPFLSTLVPFLIPILFPFALATAAALYMNFLQHLPMQQRLIVSSMAHTIVRAVEQMLPDETPGAQKKDQALQALRAITANIGLKVPAPLLEIAIESAVFELHTMYPHHDDHDPDLTGPFPYRQTIRSLPAVQLGVTPTAPTAPIPLPTEQTQPIPFPTDKRPS
jgi:Bacteriophage holin of superfamily 6 (Holin_LLH)